MGETPVLSTHLTGKPLHSGSICYFPQLDTVAIVFHTRSRAYNYQWLIEFPLDPELTSAKMPRRCSHAHRAQVEPLARESRRSSVVPD